MSSNAGRKKTSNKGNEKSAPTQKLVDPVESHKAYIQLLERQSAAVFKESKKSLDAQAAVLKGEAKLVTELARTCSSSSSSGDLTQCAQLSGLVNRWYEEVFSRERIDAAQRITKVRDNVRARGKRYREQFPAIYADLKRRDLTAVECTKLEAKVAKYEAAGRTAPSIVKLHTYRKQLTEAKQRYDQLTDSLLQYLPEVYENRLHFFDHLFQSLTNAKISEAAESSKLYTELYTLMQHQETTDEEYTQEFKGKMAAVTKLTIVAEQA